MPTKAVNIRMDVELLAYLQERAEKEHRSLSNMIITILATEKDREKKTIKKHNQHEGKDCYKCKWYTENRQAPRLVQWPDKVWRGCIEMTCAYKRKEADS